LDDDDGKKELDENSRVLDMASRFYMFRLWNLLERAQTTDQEKSLIDHTILAILSSAIAIGGYVAVPAAAKAYAKAARANVATAGKIAKGLENNRILKAAILLVQPNPNLLAASESYARRIRPDVRRVMGCSDSKRWPSIGTIKKAIEAARQWRALHAIRVLNVQGSYSHAVAPAA
jgi:hypothetical protein